MKKLLATTLCAIIAVSGFAQQRQAQPYHKFTVTKEVKTMPVRDQSRSGTCWSFSGISMFENELIRMGKGEYDLSDMWIVRHTYFDKVVKYVRMHGKIELSAGALTGDVINVMREHGIVPEEAYKGLEYGYDNHNHAELDEVLKSFGDAIIANKGKKLTTAWQDALNGILDAYFGPVPAKFTYNGKEYTPESFYKMLGLNMDDYVSIGSFTHHPFYTEFALEVPDNWSWGLSYNLPVEEMMQVTENAINKGYSVSWGSDISESGFQWRSGIAFVVPDMIDSGEGTELSRWVSLSANQQQAYVQQMLTAKIEEPTVTQEMRQIAFDNYETTDDHGMVITGIATDQDGKKFFKVQNSWGVTGPYDGYFYTSFPFVAYKTTGITVHKDALPKEIKNKLGIK